MRMSKPSRPMSRGGRAVFWFMTVFIFLCCFGGGIALTKDAMDSRAALANGPAGTFVPTDRECGRNSCTWIGDFVSDGGTTIRTGVVLRDGVRVRSSDPMPAEITNVYLHDDADRPVAYVSDVNWGLALTGGIVLLACGLVLPPFMIRVVRRHKRAANAER